MLEHVFDLPCKSLAPSKRSVDVDFVRWIINQKRRWEHGAAATAAREGVVVRGQGACAGLVVLDQSSVCGELRAPRQALQVEGFGMFSSARANACVSRGRWMYEVVLETAGVQQLGWATLACPFTDRKGVGDADDSYAFDGRRVRKWNREARAYGQPWSSPSTGTGSLSEWPSTASAVAAVAAPASSATTLPSPCPKGRDATSTSEPAIQVPRRGFLPIQPPPAPSSAAAYLLRCLSRVLELQSLDRCDPASFERLRRVKRRFPLLEELFHPISRGICEELFAVIEADGAGGVEYVAQGPLLSFLLEWFSGGRPVPRIPGSNPLFRHLILALSSSCRTASLVLLECPFSGSYPYLALACHILRREELMALWWSSPEYEFEYSLEARPAAPHPSVWRPPGSSEEMYLESSMMLTTTALSGAVSKIEELQRELCRMVMKFIPPVPPLQPPGSVFRTFLQNFMMKMRGADQKMAWSGASNNSVLVSLYMVILHFLSEGSALEGICERAKGSGVAAPGGFLHRGGRRSFPGGLLFKVDPHRTSIPRLGETEEITWDEGCMDSQDAKVTHSTRQKPCCCSGFDAADLMKILKNPARFPVKGHRAAGSHIPERSATHVAAECSTGGLNDEIVDKPSTSGQSESAFVCRHLQRLETLPSSSHSSSSSAAAVLREEELLDALLLLYHLGVSSNFKQAFYYKSHQTSLSAILDDIDRQIREKPSGEQQKGLKEARNVYREELRSCPFFCPTVVNAMVVTSIAGTRASLSSPWKQRGTYALCVWVVELLVVLSRDDSHFAYVPEFYLETVVDCVLSLCRSDPPFVSPAILIKQGLSSFVTLVAAHFDDPRILSADLKDLLLQSISFLVRHKDYVAAFERNKAAVKRMPRALLASFDHRSWILVANVLNHLCGGSGFGPSKHGDSSSSPLFQALLREACVGDEQLFSSFLNQLFNTLSMMMTEFSILIRDMQDKYQSLDPQQRKCGIIFDLSCGLARILEFFTFEIPQAFLQGPDMNLRRLTELIVFILNHVISAADSEFFDIRTMMLGPLIGIIVNLFDAGAEPTAGERNDVVGVFASMDCPAVHCGLQYLLGYNWCGVLRDGTCLARLATLERFAGSLKSRAEAEAAAEAVGEAGADGEEEGAGERCCICYAAEADARFDPCSHRSCFGCITRHLLNGQRCFFCNATVVDVVKIDRD
ncbi:unnamed protein product [Spirodela intermedia]|uniref:RING-type E3 ubiquitin transferase n=1 Tax=Spirodela intermedia TaxID=51605 RepID=A0A7I8IPN8_SPIIN|nr:unnamed protein product [Spirodela intermedia]CAA6659544.1 unnamed protein product [Spirodela intermedia]